MDNLIGTTAGRIWQYLEKNGAVTALKLKSSLGIRNSLLYLALGWLAREGKIEIGETEHTYKITLKP
jgi:hypothetical protein